ncbi:MAG: DNA mismatch repair endonuclease MutL, partial [Candidatus Brocadiia bacterium]
MGKIHLLQQAVINQIAAGEIIERPASVLKELAENSLDAGATEISVDIEGGGRQLLRIADNGEGILPEDLPVALLSHATSKLTDAEEMASVMTLGFRGEALASIAAVSELTILSRPPSLPSGHCIVCRYGEVVESSEIGMAPGTVVEVRDIFRNLPARLKFLRSPTAEASHISEMLTRFALSFPGVAFRLKVGARQSISAAPTGDPLRRVREFLGDEVADSMIPVDYSEPEWGTVRGYVSSPPTARANSRFQYTYLNSRYIRDRQISAALAEAYRGRLIGGQYPIAVLSFSIEPSAFDINVSPTKIEVRFADGHRIYSFALQAIIRALESHGGPARIEASIPAEPSGEHQESVKRSILDFYANRSGESRPDYSRPRSHQDFASPAQPPIRHEPQSELTVCGWRYIGSLANTFLMFEDGGDLIAIDQHALHERILFEELSGKATGSQRLLIPQAIELSQAEMAVWEAASDALVRAGFEVEPFGERTIAVHAVPGGFPVERCGEAIQRACAERAGAGEQGGDPAKILETIACKAAIKAGDALSHSEISALVMRYLSIEG